MAHRRTHKMVIVRFSEVPLKVVFRYKGNWWMRKIGTSSMAEMFKEDDGSTSNESVTICPKELVAVANVMIKDPYSRLIIEDEFEVVV